MLEREIEPLSTRPVGRPLRKPKVFYHSFGYEAGTWRRARRVVAKVERHPGELFPRVGFEVVFRAGVTAAKCELPVVK